MHLLNKECQYEAYKDDKSNFIFKKMLFAKFTQAHAAFGRGFCHLLWWLFLKTTDFKQGTRLNSVH